MFKYDWINERTYLEIIDALKVPTNVKIKGDTMKNPFSSAKETGSGQNIPETDWNEKFNVANEELKIEIAKYEKRMNTMRHPQADLLIYAAENKDAKFHAWHDDGETKGGIDAVLAYPKLDWKIIHKTITKWQWAFKTRVTQENYGISEFLSEKEVFSRCEQQFIKLQFTAKEFPV